jgi:shikimate kinase
MFREVEQELLTAQLVQAGNEVIITGGLPIAGDVQTNFIKLHRVENNTKG